MGWFESERSVAPAAVRLSRRVEVEGERSGETADSFRFAPLGMTTCVLCLRFIRGRRFCQKWRLRWQCPRSRERFRMEWRELERGMEEERGAWRPDSSGSTDRICKKTGIRI